MKKINANILIIIISVACTVLLAVILLIAIFIQGGERRETAGEQTPRLRVEAEKTSAAGTRTDSAFFITGENGVLPPQAIKEALRLAPEFPYHWEETAAGLLLRPDAPLASDTVYRFFTDAGHAQSWAFQTEGRFSVRSLRPEANAAQVPLQPEIEISFSRPPANISGWVEIDPAITGDWRRNGLTAAFLPAAPLRPDTLYTVTLRAGLPGMTGETLAEDYVFSFRTEHGDGSENQFLEIEGRFTETFLPDDPVAIRFQVMGGDFSGAKVSAAVYEVRDSAAYLALALAQTERVKPLCGRNSDVLIEPPAPAAPPDFVTEGVLLATASPGVLYFLPELNLDPGYYLLDMTVSGPATATAARRQKLICVSALSVYMQNPRGQTQFWINDAASGRPLAGAEITVAPTGAGVSLTAVTNADGLASLDASPAGAEPALTVKAADGRAWADLAPLAAGASGPAEPPPSQRYYSYLYFDRAAYLSADTAHFWGYLAPRRDGYELPAAVTVSLPGLPPQTAPVHRGAFSGVFSWQSLAPGQHEAELSLAGETVFSLPLLISGTEKPVYIIKAAAEKNLYRRGEKAAITATAAFFDGAPAAGLRLTAENGAASQAQTVNAAGSAAFALPEPEPDSWRPYLDRVSLRADENETAAVAVSVCRFPTDYMCEIKTEVAPGGFFLEVSTARIDFAAAEAALAAGGTAVTAPDLPERIRGEAYEQYFDAGVIRCEYLPEESGEYYDFFQKQTVKQYRYVYRESLAERLSFSTSDGRYRSELLPWQADGLVFYKVSLDYETPDGAVLREYTADIPLPSPPPATDGYRLETAKTDFTVGESLTLRPRNTLSPLPRDGRLFYAVTGDEAVVAEVTGETEFSLYCAEALLPNFDITAAYFDGKHVFPLTGPAFVFDPAERALRVEIRPERETYAPGETLNAEIKVTDASGQPRAASFIFSLADEAAFTAQEQQADAAAALYRPLVREIAGQFASYTPHAFAGVSPPAGDAPPQPAEAAAAGSAAGSEQALPTPVFLSGETDGGGRARISCQLPADMADWRLTVVACTEIGQAGDARAAVSATRPFYLRPDFSQRYTTRDDIVIVLRAGGVLPETAVSYRARVESADGAAAAEQSLSAAAASAAVCDFGKLPAGEYVFSVTAAAGGEREEAAYPFLVAESLLDSPALTESDPAGLAKTAALNYPADIFFYDGSNKLYARILLELAGAAGARADERAAADYIRAAFAGTEPE
ncbi:MAG: Ig-like domain-containing protein, partial [Gracilibacteraceae bacterium]|nr:Ig-like domain-containing protein [Gracilibacteraceae bacterium]